MNTEILDTIYEYILKQNRPYSATDIFTNLHKEIGKTAVGKILDTLVSEGSIKEKLYGKQKVYVVNQDSLPSIDESEMSELESNIADMKQKLKEETTLLKKTEAELKLYQSALTTDEAKSEIESLDKEISQSTQRLELLKEKCSNVSYEDRDRLLKLKEDNVKSWRKRKRMVGDIADTILESYPKSKKEYFEEVGIDTDEDFGCQMIN